MQSKGGSFKIFAIMAGGICLLVAVSFGGLFATGVLSSEDGCPYGYGNSAPRSASTSCKSRPEPTAQEARAVADGSALKAGLSSFRTRKEAAAEIAGVGLNAWGETTFTIRDETYLSFTRTGAPAKADNAFRRKYVTAVETDVKFDYQLVRPAPVVRALKRVGSSRPDLRFESALFGRFPTGTDIAWQLRYVAYRDDAAIGGVLLRMRPDGRNLCVFGKTYRLRGIPECGAEDAGLPTGGSPSSPAPQTDQSKAIKESVDRQIECVRKAGADAAKIQACVGG